MVSQNQIIDLANAVMMREAAPIGDDLVSRLLLDLLVRFDRIIDAPVFEGKVEIDAGA